ncbi:MAG: hypothetical protein ACR2MD_19585 [Aridibacter sp.]|jgi:ABC-type transport system involved in cytochrome c biogenesis permease subunit
MKHKFVKFNLLFILLFYLVILGYKFSDEVLNFIWQVPPVEYNEEKVIA